MLGVIAFSQSPHDVEDWRNIGVNHKNGECNQRYNTKSKYQFLHIV
jgi:hypothetical protein